MEPVTATATGTDTQSDNQTDHLKLSHGNFGISRHFPHTWLKERTATVLSTITTRLLKYSCRTANHIISVLPVVMHSSQLFATGK